jgi:hypothetical protein
MMNAVSIHNQLELPLRQVAHLLQVPPFVVVRLALRLQQMTPKTPNSQDDQRLPPVKVGNPSENFYTLTQIQLLENCMDAIRQGRSLTGFLEGFQQQGAPLCSPEKDPLEKSKGLLSVNIRRLPAYKGKTPFLCQQKAVLSPVKKPLPAPPSAFPILKKRSTPPAQWFPSR